MVLITSETASAVKILTKRRCVVATKSLTALSQEEVHEIGIKCDIKNLSGEVGNTKGSIGFLVGMILFLGICFLQITWDLLDPLSGSIVFVGFICVLAGLDGLSMFFVNVPSYTAVVTRNFFWSGTIYIKDSGLKSKFPWELFSLDDFINMRRDVLEKTSVFLTKDGMRISYRWTLQYHPIALLLGLYVSTEHEDFVTGLIDIVENKLKEIIGTMNVKDIREQAEISEQINGLLRQKLKNDTFEAKGVTIEERFGLFIENATIGPPIFSEDYQQALEAHVIRVIIQGDALSLAEALEIPTGEALNMIAIFNKESVKKEIREVTVGEQIINAFGKLGIDVGQVIEAIRKAREAKTSKAGGDDQSPSATTKES